MNPIEIIKQKTNELMGIKNILGLQHPNVFMLFNDLCNATREVEQALAKQEKKGELLGLYKKLVRAEAKRVRTLEYYKRYSWGLQDYKNARKTAKELKQKIKPLEEELK